MSKGQNRQRLLDLNSKSLYNLGKTSNTYLNNGATRACSSHLPFHSGASFLRPPPLLLASYPLQPFWLGLFVPHPHVHVVRFPLVLVGGCAEALLLVCSNHNRKFNIRSPIKLRIYITWLFQSCLAELLGSILMKSYSAKLMIRH